MEVIIHVTSVEYDITEEDLEGTSLTVTAMNARLPQTFDFQDIIEVDEEITDRISDITGWLVKSAIWEVVE